jgi:hypothetical protein
MDTASKTENTQKNSETFLIVEVTSTDAHDGFPDYVALNQATLRWFEEKEAKLEQIEAHFPDVRRVEYYLPPEMKSIFLRDEDGKLKHGDTIEGEDFGSLSIGEAKNPHVQMQIVSRGDSGSLGKGWVRASHEDFSHNQHFFKSREVFQMIEGSEEVWGRSSGVQLS